MVVCSIILGACGSATVSQRPSATPADGATSDPGSSPPVLPVPPEPVAVAAGTVAEQAAALADATEPGSASVLAGWLAAYDALGIPVLTESGPLGTTGDDPIGPPYWLVWYTSSLATTQAGFRLVDYVRVFGLPDDEIDGVEAADLLLDDVRAAAANQDPAVALAGQFIAEKIRRGPSRVDPLDTAVDAGQVSIDGATAELLSWFVIRDYVHWLAAGETGGIDVGAPPARLVADDFECGSGWVSDATRWIGWMLDQPGVGNVPSIGGLLGDRLKELNQDLRSKSLAEKADAITTKVNAITALLTLLMQYYTLAITPDLQPSPLERWREASDGDDAKVHWLLHVDLQGLPDGNNLLLCAASYFASTHDVTFSFPRSGKIPGAEILVQGGKGFVGDADGQLLLLPDSAPGGRVTTDANGRAETLVRGMARPKTLPPSVPEVQKEFSLHVEAQPESIDGDTMVDIFISGFKFGAAPSGAGAWEAAIGLAKVFHWDLGEYVFPLIDYESGSQGFAGTWPRETGNHGPQTIAAVSCTGDLSGRWAVLAVVLASESSSTRWWTI